jgi:hypothetical protein
MKKLALLIPIVFCIQLTISSQPCLPDGTTFTTQSQIDNFQTAFPNCTEIEGDVLIQGNDITNLNGLNVLTTILGTLSIGDGTGGNPALTNLTGLVNVTIIGGNVDIVGNFSLTELTGLNNLTSCGGYFGIAQNSVLTNLSGLEGLTSVGLFLAINVNDELTSLAGLESLNSIGGELQVIWNDALTSLSGLDNINPESIENLLIYDNPLLSDCEILSICNYLVSPNGTVEIHDNATGCNSQEEVEDACGIVAVDEVILKQDVLISPNPFTSTTTLSYTISEPTTVTISIFNPQGQLIEKIEKEQLKGEQKVQWSAEGLPAGMYYFRIQAGDKIGSGKMVKMK